MGEKEKREIIALATDFPRLWNNPKTSHRDKKRIVRYLIEDVTLTRTDDGYMTIPTASKVEQRRWSHYWLRCRQPRCTVFPANETFREIRNLPMIDTVG